MSHSQNNVSGGGIIPFRKRQKILRIIENRHPGAGNLDYILKSAEAFMKGEIEGFPDPEKDLPAGTSLLDRVLAFALDFNQFNVGEIATGAGKIGLAHYQAINSGVNEKIKGMLAKSGIDLSQYDMQPFALKPQQKGSGMSSGMSAAAKFNRDLAAWAQPGFQVVEGQY